MLGSTTTPEAVGAGIFAIGCLIGMYSGAQYLEKTREKRRRRSNARANKKGRGGR